MFVRLRFCTSCDGFVELCKMSKSFNTIKKWLEYVDDPFLHRLLIASSNSFQSPGEDHLDYSLVHASSEDDWIERRASSG